MNGFLLVDKPSSISSFAVVAKVRRILSEVSNQKAKVGHTGTLDPLATGLMIILVGSYCKDADKYLKKDKVYKVKMTLGAVSTTGDAEGEIKYKSKKQPSLEEVEQVLKQF